MEIILKEDIVNLGYKNDIVNVKSGYGRNYLIPTGKAVIASPSAKKMLAEELKQRAHKLEKIKKDAEATAAKLEGVSLTVPFLLNSTNICITLVPCIAKYYKLIIIKLSKRIHLITKRNNSYICIPLNYKKQVC